jgi:hypothetical protein
MQNGKYGVDVIVDGNVIPERVDGTVAVPFGADYAIRLRNDDHRRAEVMIYLDEQNISGDGFVVNGRSSWVLECPVDKAVTFRIASSHSQAAAEHGKAGDDVHGEKGLIRVVWRAELNPPYVPGLVSRGMNKTFSLDSYTPRGGQLLSGGSNLESYNVATPCSATIPKGGVSFNATSPVVTVEGAHSNQRFVEVKMGTLDTVTTTLLIKMRGYEASTGVPANGTSYCPNCRTKTMKLTDKYCRQCGTTLSTGRSSLGKPR